MRRVVNRRLYATQTQSLREPFPGLPVAAAAPANVPSVVQTSTVGGLQVVTVDAATPYSGAVVTFRAGTRFETSETRGAAAHLAKLLLGGNASGQTDVMTTRNLLQSTTAAYARSSRETLSYAVEFSRDNQAAVVGQLGQVVRPSVRSWEVDDSRTFLEEDMDEAESEAAALVDAAHFTAFRGSALGHSSLTVSSLGSAGLAAYRDRFLTRANAVVVGVGVEHAAFAADVERAFAGLPAGQRADGGPRTAYVGGECHHESGDEPLFVLAFEGAGLGTREMLVAGVLQEVLGRTPARLFAKPRPGDGMASRLNKRLHGEAAVLFAEAFAASHSDAGLFGVQAQALEGQERHVLAAVAAELGALARTPLPEAELAGARLRYKRSVVMGAEEVDMRGHFLARQALYTDKVLCRNDYSNRIDSVTAVEVQALVKKMLGTPATLVSQGSSANYPALASLKY